jgi:predicted RNA methylase
MESEHRDHAASQWFTPPWLAEHVWEWAKQGTHESVLEPSAGNGALLKPIAESPGDCLGILACERDIAHIPALRALQTSDPERVFQLTVLSGDFLAAPRDLLGRFDLALMNPPYERGQTEAFTLRALELADRVIVIAQGGFIHGQRRRRELWDHVDIRRGVWLSARPQFGTGASGSETAMRDFVVLELVKRTRPREPGETMACTWEWW